MGTKRLIILRHGLTKYNVEKRIQGNSNVPLLEEGYRQAQQAAQMISNYAIAQVWCSPLKRAVATAQIVAQVHNLVPNIDERLVERRYGQWEGKTLSELETEYNQAYNLWKAGQDPLGCGVEPRLVAGKRAAEAITEYYENNMAGDVLVVSHGGVLSAAMQVLLGHSETPWFGMAGIDNCHWGILAHNADRHPSWRVCGWNLGKVHDDFIMQSIG